MADLKYWKSLEEKEGNVPPAQANEFSTELPVVSGLADKAETLATGRRDFLKVMGFSVTAAAVAASCEMPVRKSIPLLVKPDEMTPGIASYYASTYAEGGDYCSVLVKTRDGRPIKIEGNKLSKISRGGTSAVVQASVLGLYDNYRLKRASANGEETSWKKADEAIVSQLDEIQARGGKIRILSSTVLSPSTKQAIKDFTAKYPATKQVTYDAVSYSGMLKANEQMFGKKALPSYRFDAAELIVSVGADFLGTWISPVEYASQYAAGRKVSKENKKMSRHVQVESFLSLTGSNADKRIVVKPSELASALLTIYQVVQGNKPEGEVPRIAYELLAAKGKSLVVCGLNDVNAQLITNEINRLLGNYGATIDFTNFSNQRQGDDAEMDELVKELGTVDALIIFDANPVYTYPGDAFKAGLEKVKLSVSLNPKKDETTALCKYYCPNHHYLESWNDAEPKNGQFSITQPTIAPLFKTRSAAESFLKWAGIDTPYYDYIRNYWSQNIFPKQTHFVSFDMMWDRAVQDGVLDTQVAADTTVPNVIDLSAATAALSKPASSDAFDLVLYEKTAIRDGKFADNPWLQEVPDPVSKITWDNYACVSKSTAEKLGAKKSVAKIVESVGLEADVVKVSANGYEITLPVIVQPGTPDNTIAVALGYGRVMDSKTKTVGQNAYPFLQAGANFVSGASITVVAGSAYRIAQTQMHHSIQTPMEKVGKQLERRIVKETTLAEYSANPFAGNEDREEIKKELVTLYPENEKLKRGNQWEMTIDLSSCIGCSACVVSCTAENNVPVVGKDEVVRSREMHWLRIDRYFSGEETNPSVIFQPMLCQHCDNAPCENVCPVAATNHSSDGLNQMTYNRCIGTRYCANNCPFKVRRFNWFDYLGADSFRKGTIFENDKDAAGMEDDLTRMVLNPDVTVRSRGVIEKCSFCVQRIQAGKNLAKRQNRHLTDGDIVTACQDACPTNAISFGDINNENSEVYKIANDERGFKVLEELHVMPSITYLTKVRNTEKSEA